MCFFVCPPFSGHLEHSGAKIRRELAHTTDSLIIDQTFSYGMHDVYGSALSDFSGMLVRWCFFGEFVSIGAGVLRLF